MMTACHAADIGTEELAQWFDAQNQPVEDLIRLSSDADVISFSHFLPLQVRPPQTVFLLPLSIQPIADAASRAFLALRFQSTTL